MARILVVDQPVRAMMVGFGILFATTVEFYG